MSKVLPAAREERDDDVDDARHGHGQAPEHLAVDGEAGHELLDGDAADGDDGADDHGRPGRGRRAPLPVQAADDDRAAAAGEDGPGDGEEEEDVLALLEEQAEDEEKAATARMDELEDLEVLLRREGLLPEGHDDVLDEDAAPGVEVGLVAADGRGQHDRRERAHQPDRQELGQGDRHGQLAPQGVRGQAVEDGPDRGGRGRESLRRARTCRPRWARTRGTGPTAGCPASWPGRRPSWPRGRSWPRRCRPGCPARRACRR